ncbi:MAG: hypothetical protein WBE45_21345 [Terriglobales bacterium]
MSNDQLNEYFERAIQQFAVEFFNEQMQLASEQEESESQQLIDREIEWYEKQKDIVRQGDTLLISVGPAVWKVPAKDSEFVKNVLPVFAKNLEDLEPPEAAEVRKLQKSLRANRWRLKPSDREAQERDIEDAKSRLERAKTREPIPRYGIYKTLSGRDVGVHRLYVRCGDDEKVSAFDGDLTNFCDVPIRYEVQRNFGLTERQQKALAPIYAESTVRNLYIVSSGSNPAHERSQGDFERDGIVPSADPENARVPIQPNADLGTRTGTPYGVQDAGTYRQPIAAEIEEGGMDSIGYIERPAKDADRLLIEPKRIAPRSERLGAANVIYEFSLFVA